MRRAILPVILLGIFLITSCSYFLSSYDVPQTITHGYVQGVTPANAETFRNRSYPTVKANWPGPGGNKVWLGVNLGATHEPANSVDDRASRAGWYFQFNRKQGFHHNGEVPTPQWRIQSINEDTNWEITNDPCRILLGSPWRVPTVEEIRAFREASVSRGGMGEGNRTSAFNSRLRLHAAGELHSFDGDLRNRGNFGRYWASTQLNRTDGEAFSFGDSSRTYGSNKAFGRPVRCIRD